MEEERNCSCLHDLGHPAVFSTILALLRSEAVHSMNTSWVLRLMAECAPLIMGGSDSTVRLAS